MGKGTVLSSRGWCNAYCLQVGWWEWGKVEGAHF